MTTKEIAKNVIDTLPDEASMDEIIDALYIKAKFDRGVKEIQDGKGISNEDAKDRLKKWLK